jgi:arsenate reductase (thioredoxin)
MLKKTIICPLLCVTLLFTLTVNAQQRDTKKKTEQPSVVVFVCEHGAARSIVSAAHFNKLAKERRLNLRAIARGTNPDQELAPKVVAGLRADGLAPSESAPKKISKADLAGAKRVIAFCELPADYPGSVLVEHWDGVPPMNEDYGKARDWLLERINRLLEELKPKQQ